METLLLTPVSYTHLDSTTVNVRVSSEGNYDGYVTGTEELKITARPITITAVSYTHLDVYKRQVVIIKLSHPLTPFGTHHIRFYQI